MSVVAVKKYDKYIEICADGFCGGRYNIGQLDKNSCKLYTDDKNYIFGGVGSLFDISLFNHIISKNNDIKADYSTVDISKIYEIRETFFSNLSSMTHYKDSKRFDERMNYSSIITVINGKAYLLEHFGVIEVDNIIAIGAGGNEVESDLINGLSPTEAVIKSAKSNVYISEPITTYRYWLKDGRIEKIERDSE